VVVCEIATFDIRVTGEPKNEEPYSLVVTEFRSTSGGLWKVLLPRGQDLQRVRKGLGKLRCRSGEAKERAGLGAYEYRFVEDCMKRKGYKLVGERSLPLDAKRRDPDRSTMGLLRGRRQGVAGAVQAQ
jgi:hypothetical protein